MADPIVSADWLRSQRWFAGKSRPIRGVSLFDQVRLAGDARWSLITVSYEDGADELYSLPGNLETPDFQGLLLKLIRDGEDLTNLRFDRLLDITETPEPRLLRGEQSNTSIAYGSSWILKLFRRLSHGESRDLELGRFLTHDAHFPYSPAIAGAITYAGDITLGVLQRFVPNQGDGWSYVLSHLHEPPQAPDDVYWSEAGLPSRGNVIAEIEQLGHITGAMHHALASRPDLPDFAPEPAGAEDMAAWLADVRFQLAAAGQTLGDVGAYDQAIDQLASDIRPENVIKIQIHGDYHLGQVLKTEDAFTIIDFEGEPARPLAERRAKQPPLRDVAGMLRSLHYASHANPAWYEQASQAFLRGWTAEAGSQFTAGNDEATHRLITFFQLAKALYELNYEINNRPDWVAVPLRGIQHLMEQL